MINLYTALSKKLAIVEMLYIYRYSLCLTYIPLYIWVLLYQGRQSDTVKILPTHWCSLTALSMELAMVKCYLSIIYFLLVLLYQGNITVEILPNHWCSLTFNLYTE